MLSPVKTKLGCWPVVLVEVLLVLLLLDGLEARRSIQGTATCLPPAVLVLEDEPTLLPPTALLPPKLLPWELLELPSELSVELLLLGDVLEVPLEELLPPGVVAPPVLPLPIDELREMTAKSMRPDPGLTMMSLIVPISLPELLVT